MCLSAVVTAFVEVYVEGFRGLVKSEYGERNYFKEHPFLVFHVCLLMRQSAEAPDFGQFFIAEKLEVGTESLCAASLVAMQFTSIL